MKRAVVVRRGAFGVAFGRAGMDPGLATWWAWQATAMAVGPLDAPAMVVAPGYGLMGQVLHRVDAANDERQPLGAA